MSDTIKVAYGSDGSVAIHLTAEQRVELNRITGSLSGALYWICEYRHDCIEHDASVYTNHPIKIKIGYRRALP